MLSRVNKVSAIGIICLVLLSGLAATTVASVQHRSSGKDVGQTSTITLYRYGPDGSIKPVKVDIKIIDGQDLGEAILEKCSELVDADAGIQNCMLGNGSDINISVLSRVKSWGRGFHWKSPFTFRVPFPLILKYNLFATIPLRYKIFGINVIPRVYCNYSNDKGAKTEITPLLFPSRQNQNTTVVEGNHTVTVLGFIGYACWRGTNAQRIDKLGLRTGFDGYAFSIIYNKLS
ncbi:hypothetical protein KA005_26260 [bacterium]|nr:hypothetical protein [bacterium]